MPALDTRTMKTAFEVVDSDEEAMQAHAILAMGILAGAGYPCCHAAVVRLYQRAWPTAALPGLVAHLFDGVIVP